jgi:alanyl-tRNA synthetase
VAGLQAYQQIKTQAQLLEQVALKINTPVVELDRKIDALLVQQKELEKQLKALQQKEAAAAAKDLVKRAVSLQGIPAIIEDAGALDGDALQSMVNELKGQFKGVVLLAGASNGAVALVASVSPEFTAKVQAGKLIQEIARIVGGKGGGKADSARGGGRDASKLAEALAKARSLLSGS